MNDEREALLAKTTKELEELREEFNEFAYIVSHDLSAPFRQIEGFSQIIAKREGDGFDEKTKRHFDLIIKGSTTGKEILSALLVYSRLNMRAEPFYSVDCNRIVEEAKGSLAAMIERSSAEIICSNLPTISGDGKQLTTLFYELIKNALLFQENGSIPKINIGAVEQKAAWQFCVRDNGIGIPENLTEKVFKILRRAVSGKDYPGLGMGLASAKKIVQHHGGDIWMETEKGAGSAFYFTIVSDLN